MRTLFPVLPLICALLLNAGLTAEMRQLDSERQSLVYNHHHELIAASDTIAAVRTSLYATQEALH